MVTLQLIPVFLSVSPHDRGIINNPSPPERLILAMEHIPPEIKFLVLKECLESCTGEKSGTHLHKTLPAVSKEFQALYGAMALPYLQAILKEKIGGGFERAALFVAFVHEDNEKTEDERNEADYHRLGQKGLIKLFKERLQSQATILNLIQRAISLHGKIVDITHYVRSRTFTTPQDAGNAMGLNQDENEKLASLANTYRYALLIREPGQMLPSVSARTFKKCPFEIPS